MASPLNVANRGCILIGSVMTDESKYCIWFVRSTIVYSTWNYVSGVGMVEKIMRVITGLYMKWRPYADTEIKLSVCSQSVKLLIKVSGTMSSIYHDMVQISSNQVSFCSSVSFGCTTLRIQVIKHTKTGVVYEMSFATMN
jgi:hypothetical protein